MPSSFLAESHLVLQHVAAARVGQDIQIPPRTLGFFSGTLVLLWKPGRGYTQVVEVAGTTDQWIERIHLARDNADWQHLRVSQVLTLADQASLTEVDGGRLTEVVPSSDRDTLSQRLVDHPGRFARTR